VKSSAQKPPENLRLINDNSDSDEDHRQQEKDNVDYNPNLKQVFPYPNPIY
jgi:hypothetical protein